MDWLLEDCGDRWRRANLRRVVFVCLIGELFCTVPMVSFFAFLMLIAGSFVWLIEIADHLSTEFVPTSRTFLREKSRFWESGFSETIQIELRR